MKQPLPKALLAIAGGSLLVKLAVLLAVGEIQPVRDEVDYLGVAQSLADGHGWVYPNPRWGPLHAAPLYPLFLALIHWLGGAAFAAKVVQVFLSTVTVVCCYLLAERCWDRRAALWTAGLVAFYPTLVAFTHYNWSETFFLFWLALAVTSLFGAGGQIRGPTGLLWAGMLFGLAALSRSVIVYLVPVLAVWILVHQWRRGQAVLRSIMFVAGFAVSLAPWTLYVMDRYDHFALISTGPGKIWHDSYNVYPPTNQDLGMHEEGTRLALEPSARPPARGRNPILRARREQAMGLAYLADNPLVCFQRFWVRVAQFLNPTSFLIRHLRREQYSRGVDGRAFRPPLNAAVREVIIWATVASYLLAMTLGVIGLVAMPPSALRFVLAVLLLYFVAVYGMTYAMSRYRLPVMPFVMLAAAQLLSRPGAAWIRLRRLRCAAPALILVAGLVVAFSVYFENLWAD